MSWRFFGASVIGSSHESAGTVCQDSSTFESFVAPCGEVFIAIVSDGAGSACRAEVGSKIICDVFLESIKRSIFEEKKTLGDFSKGCIELCIAEAYARIKQAADSEKKNPRDFAGTLLGIAVSSSCFIAFQIGDGAIVHSADGQNYRVAFWPEQGTYANETFFLTDDDAKEHLHFFKSDTNSGLPCKIALFSDGLQHLLLRNADKSVYAPFFIPRMTLLEKMPPGQTKEFSNKLVEFLSSKGVNERTDDDKTLIMACQGFVENAIPSPIAIVQNSEIAVLQADSTDASNLSVDVK